MLLACVCHPVVPHEFCVSEVDVAMHQPNISFNANNRLAFISVSEGSIPP